MEKYKKLSLAQDVVLQRFEGIDASIFMPSKWAPSGGFPGFQWKGKKGQSSVDHLLIQLQFAPSFWGG